MTLPPAETLQTEEDGDPRGCAITLVMIVGFWVAVIAGTKAGGLW